MESLGMVILLLSVGVYSWAVLGLIKPVSAGLPNRWASVPIWIGSVVLFIIGASFIEDGDNTSASSASRAPELNSVAEPAEITCADWNITAFFEVTKVSDVTRCLQAGADPNARAEEGYTPLHRAVGGGNVEAVMALLEAGADLEARDSRGDTPLHDAMRQRRATADAEVVMALLEAGADPNARAEEGYTPLHVAAARGIAQFVTALLEAGANPNARHDSGGAPLHSADTAEVVTALLEAGANPNARDGGGNTPLHFADTAEVVTALLKAGADPKARNSGGLLPVDYAEIKEQLKGTDAYWKLNEARFQ